MNNKGIVDKKILICTACDQGSDAEQLHPLLQVPICGACVVSLQDADLGIVDNQISSCVWCGGSDFVNLVMCDTCTRSCCEGCITRNFGAAEAKAVKDQEIWSCYVCQPTESLRAIQVNKDRVYLNIDKAYAAVHPPSIHDIKKSHHEITAELSPEERNFAAIFTNDLGNVSIQNAELIGQYLTAMDIAIILRISKGLRKLFQSELFIIPGLFKTEYGIENKCKLYDHQIVSLNRMIQIENSNIEFGSLRGGIFGDEPGLGKTVTSLALIASTAGILPQKPSSFWNKETINEHWSMKKGQFQSLLGPVLNRLQKCPEMGKFELQSITDLRNNIEKYCSTIEYFESTGKYKGFMCRVILIFMGLYAYSLYTIGFYALYNWVILIITV